MDALCAAIRQAALRRGLAARLTAADLRAVGINTNCAPVLDVPVPGSHDIIGDRAYGAEPARSALSDAPWPKATWPAACCR